MTFETRTGATHYAFPYDARGITRMTKGRIKLSIAKCTDLAEGYCSAGLLGERAQEGKYVFHTTGRVDWMDPNINFGIWLYADSNADEIDVVECCRWGDKNNPYLYLIGMFKEGVRQLPDYKGYGRAFSKHRFTLEITKDSIFIKAEGERAPNEWIIVGHYSSPRTITDLGQIRVAIYVRKEGFTYKDVGSRGTMSVILEPVQYYPPTIITKTETEESPS